jgi:hypothetical protein
MERWDELFERSDDDREYDLHTSQVVVRSLRMIGEPFSFVIDLMKGFLDRTVSILQSSQVTSIERYRPGVRFALYEHYTLPDSDRGIHFFGCSIEPFALSIGQHGFLSTGERFQQLSLRASIVKRNSNEQILQTRGNPGEIGDDFTFTSGDEQEVWSACR